MKKLPPVIADYFIRQGVDINKIFTFVKADFDCDLKYADVYAAFDSECLYILSGTEKFDRGKRGKVFRVFELSGFERIPVALIEKLAVERNLGTGRMYCEGGGNRVLLTFSVGLSEYLEHFVKLFNLLKEGKEEEINACGEIEQKFCPRCNRRYPDQTRAVCPDCLKSSSVLIRLLGLTKDYKWSILAVIVGVLCATALGILLPYFSVTMFYDEVLNAAGKYYGMIIMVVGIIAGMRLINVLFSVVYGAIVASVAARIVYDMKMKVFRAMQKLGLGFFTNKQTGVLMTRINEDSNFIYWFLIDCIPYVCMSMFMIGGVMGLLFWIHWSVGLVMFLAVPGFILTMKIFYAVEERLHRKNYVNTSLESAYVNDSINGQRIIKTYSKENYEIERFKELDERTINNEMKIRKLEFLEYPIVNMIFKLCQTFAVFLGCLLLKDGKILIGVVLSITSFTALLFNPLDFLSFVPSYASRAVDAAARIFEISEAKSDCAPPQNPVLLPEFEGNIEIKDVSFNYELQRPIIKNINLSIPSGAMLGIAGKSGAGKTTLINLMSRLYDVKSGAIYIDGINVKDIDVAVLRKNIGIVSQESYLFIGTIADNIRYANPAASIQDVISAAKAANAHDFIMKLPNAYETVVGEGGQDLSGGEKQRVSIARAILQNPKILILDEATAAMDTKTERNIQLSLDKLRGGRTTIAIAHRLSTLRGADALAVLANGEIVEYGTHRELLTKKGEYYKLFKIQTEAIKFMDSIE